MRSRNTERWLDQGAAGRRDFLRFLATAPFAAQASLWLIACGGEQEAANPYAGEKGVEGDAMPEEEASGATAGSSATGDATDAADAGDAAEAQPASAGGSGDGELVTEIAAMQPTVEALKYTHESTTEGQRCDNCQFYSAQGDGLGKCQLFTQGLVKSGGWCSSWTKKVQTG